MGEGEERGEHALHVLDHIRVAGADHVEALAAGDGVLAGVGSGIVGVAVHLDDQAEGRAEEIGDPSAELGLAAELEAAEFAV